MVFYALMPRIKSDISIEVVEARQRLQRFLAVKGNSETKLARATGVPQYTISRFATGRTKTLTPAIQQVLSYALNGMEVTFHTLSEDPRLGQVLTSAWDGTEAQLQLLIKAVEALAPFLRTVQLRR
jgi:DNA-binding Xre family transcriptional regulator